MKCKNTNNKCDYSERIKPIDGKGSFQGYDVFQCPKCKEVATTVKKSDIKKGLPEGISPSSNPRTKAQMISENNSDEFRDYAKRENITPKESCPNCDIEIDDQNKRGQPACGNCGKPPSEYNPDQYQREPLTKDGPKEMCPGCGIEATEGNEVAGFKCPNCDQQPKHHPSNFAYEDLGDNTGLPSRINKFVSKSANNEDMANRLVHDYPDVVARNKREPWQVKANREIDEVAADFNSRKKPPEPPADAPPHALLVKPSPYYQSKGGDKLLASLDNKINKFIAKAEKNIFGDAGKQEGKEFFVEGEPDKINYYGRKTKLDKSIKKAIDTPLYSIKKDNPDPDAAYDEMRERRSVRKPKIAPDLDAMKDDVDVEKWRPSKGAGAAIGGGTGAIIAGPLGAAGGAYLGHKLGRDKVKKTKDLPYEPTDVRGIPQYDGAKTKAHPFRVPKTDAVRMAATKQNIPVKDIKIKRYKPSDIKGLPMEKAVPGWESTSQNPCPTCGQEMPNNGMECATHSNVIGLASRINNFVDKGRDFQTKGERREQTKRPRMPMSGRNTGELYRNAVERRAHTPLPQKKIKKSNPRIYDNGGETIDKRGPRIPISPKLSVKKAGAPVLPCHQCGKQVPHFKSSPPTTQGLCSECIRISLTKPNAVKKALWNTQKVCTDPKCGWKQPYDKNDKRHSVLHQATACPQCKKPVNTEGFSPDF